MEVQRVQKSKNWYISQRQLFKKLAIKVESIIVELLEENDIDIHAVNSRAKEIESFIKKISKKSYSQPEDEVHDLAGIRIITYVESDLNRVSEVVKSTFNVDNENSVDKRQELGTDRVGYQSVHYVAELKADRLKLPEYSKFKGLKFEIQIRTILQHAWAEIEHDRNYKFTGQLPSEIKRRFTVLAGSLELADREFNSIASEIDRISNDVVDASKSGNLDISINSTTLKSYLRDKLERLLENNKIEEFITIDEENEVIDQLRKFNINTLSSLDQLLTAKYIEAYENHIGSSIYSDFHTLIANALLYKHHGSFFDKIDPGFYTYVCKAEAEMLKGLGIPIDEIAQQRNIELE